MSWKCAGKATCCYRCSDCFENSTSICFLDFAFIGCDRKRRSGERRTGMREASPAQKKGGSEKTEDGSMSKPFSESFGL